MQQARFSKAVADLRQWVDGPEPDRSPPRQAGIELLRLASEVADSLPDLEGRELLQERARRYYRTIESPFFQSMCDLARYHALSSWQAETARTGRLPRMPDKVDVTEENINFGEDQVSDWRDLLRRFTDEPEGSPQEPFPCSSRLGRPVEDREALTPTSVIPDLRRFTLRLQGVLVGQDLAGFIYRLERIATFFEGEAGAGEEPVAVRSRQEFRRLISYFCGILSWADSDHLRGSYLIVSCHDSLKGRDGFHMSSLYAEWLTADLKDAGRVILAAAESLGRRAEEEGARTAPSPPPDVDADAIAGGRTEVAEAPEGGADQAPGQEQSDEGDQEAWEGPSSTPPETFADAPLIGEQWQIAWALKQAGILTKDTPKALKNKVEKKVALWGKQSGRDHYVYVNKDFDPDRIQRALQELEAIKVRGRYHPRQYELPSGYQKHQALPLGPSTKETLAQILHEVDLLDDPTVACLDETIAAGKVLFGKYHERLFTLYLREGCPVETVIAARNLLQSKQGSAGAAGSLDRGDSPNNLIDRP